MPNIIFKGFRTRARGISLLELTIVLGIVAVTLAMYLSGVRTSFGSSGLAAQAEEVHAIFNAARTHAMKTNTNTCVVLSRVRDDSARERGCKMSLEYFYTLKRAKNVSCQATGNGGTGAGVERQAVQFSDLDYQIGGVLRNLSADSCQVGTRDAFVFLAGSGFLKTNDSTALEFARHDQSTHMHLFNPRAVAAGHWRFRVEQSGVLILTGE
ncbi:MAG TPA: type II secretion system protein [Limnobacter sp.]|nr:type II secretion system protein [Limnobacter sp.]